MLEKKVFSLPNELTPRVSVLVPVFNTAKFIVEALQSISRQSFQDFELLVLDDGSSDGSKQLLEAYAALEPRMRLIARENRGLIASRNELLSAARGEFVAWMDSDDISHPERLAHQVSKFDTMPELVCLGGYAQCMDPEGQALNTETYPLLHDEILAGQQLMGGAMRFASTMMRRDAALRLGGFREPFKMGEDFDFLLRLSERGRMGNLPEVLYLYRQHLTSVTAGQSYRWANFRETILDLARERREHGRDRLQLGQSIEISVAHKPNNAESMARAYLWWAQCASQNSNKSLAWKYAFKAIKSEPGNQKCWRAIVKLSLGWTL